MKIVRIFADIKSQDSILWATNFNQNLNNEFDRLFDNWNDPEYLERYFSTNAEFLATDFWNQLSIEDAVNKVLAEAEDFEEMIYELAHKRIWNGRKNIAEIFQPLSKQNYDSRNRQKFKARPSITPPFLRIYALKLEDETYVITGGAIKLTETMEQHKDLQTELMKLQQVKDYLKANGISYLDDLTTF